jgi:hypothetical protein
LLASCAYLCIGLLLMTTIAQALHCCELVPLRTAHHFGTARSAPASSAVCLICASGHTPSLAAPMTSVAVPGHITSVCGTIGQSFHSALQMFALHVRPPPSL